MGDGVGGLKGAKGVFMDVVGVFAGIGAKGGFVGV